VWERESCQNISIKRAQSPCQTTHLRVGVRVCEREDVDLSDHMCQKTHTHVCVREKEVVDLSEHIKRLTHMCVCVRERMLSCQNTSVKRHTGVCVCARERIHCSQDTSIDMSIDMIVSQKTHTCVCVCETECSVVRTYLSGEPNILVVPKDSSTYVCERERM